MEESVSFLLFNKTIIRNVVPFFGLINPPDVRAVNVKASLPNLNPFNFKYSVASQI